MTLAPLMICALLAGEPPLGQEWKALKVDVVRASSAQPKSMDFLDFIETSGDHGAAVARAITEAIKPLPVASRSTFVRGLALPWIATPGSQTPGGQRFQFVFDLDDDKMFAAELAYIKAFMASAAYSFLNCPRLTEGQRTKLLEQIEAVLADFSEECRTHGYDAKATAEWTGWLRRLAAQSAQADAWAAALAPVSDDRLATLRRELRAALGKGETSQPSSRPDAMQQWILGRQVAEQARKIAMAFHRPPAQQEGPGTKGYELQNTSQEARAEVERLRKGPETQPASSPTTQGR